MRASVATAQTNPVAPFGDPNAAVFELRGVRKSFDAVPVLQGVDLVLRRGETLGLIGPSGSGKSVLLKCLVGLIDIDQGQLDFCGKSLSRMGQDEQEQLRRHVGFLFQEGGLFDSLTVEENLEYGLRERFFRTMKRKQRRGRVAWALDVVGLPLSEADTLPEELSGGMRKRVGIARTIVTHPEVVLYDDPTEGLDPPNAHRISDLIAELRDELGVTSIVASHDLRTVFTVCDRVAFLYEGRILETAAPAALAESSNPLVQDFVIGHPPEEPLDPRESRPPEPWKES